MIGFIPHPDGTKSCTYRKSCTWLFENFSHAIKHAEFSKHLKKLFYCQGPCAPENIDWDIYHSVRFHGQTGSVTPLSGSSIDLFVCLFVCLFVDWFWFLSWLIHKGNNLYQNCSLWIPTLTGTAWSWIWRSQAKRQEAYERHDVITNIN